jgi:hypothetical protein
MQSELEKYVSTLPPSSAKPDALPLAHATTVRSFTEISDALALVPRRCDLIERDVVFLSYGRVDYRPGAQLVGRAPAPPPELPVVLLFQPALLEHVNCCYPFDTGALLGGRFGNAWKDTLSPVAATCALEMAGPEAAPRLVEQLYGCNCSYMSGDAVSPTPVAGRPPILDALLKFLHEPLYKAGADHRQHTIECVAGAAVPIGTDIFWIAVPEGELQLKAYELLNRINPHRRNAHVHGYRWRSPNLDVAGIAAVLADKAWDAIEQRFPDRVCPLHA